MVSGGGAQIELIQSAVMVCAFRLASGSLAARPRVRLGLDVVIAQ